MRDHIFSRASSLPDVSKWTGVQWQEANSGLGRRDDVLLLADADNKLVPAEQHQQAAAGDERAGAEQAAGREVALEEIC